ncbi:MAG TPA: PaaX family transcriptional regulator C-terminal domain-containing protein [Acidimicrobiales bacterium]|nr:PaaX family transcriptional regulator C-terminal domain-containing protein [Acidimicrobiales bacterium]
MVQDRNRPLTARSVLASTLLGADPPELPVAHLLAVAGLFGVNPNRARVALSRMVASGEATTDGTGRYRLAGHLLVRQRRQAVSRAGRTGRWAGHWQVVVLTSVGDTAEVRTQRRRALEAARLGELRQGVWLRPDNLDVELDDTLDHDSQRFVARPSGDGAALARRLWDVEGWAVRSRQLLTDMAGHPTTGAADLAPGFVLSAAVLRHLQADPLLPASLLAQDWPGDELRRAYDDFDAGYRSVLAEWGRRVG